ncbi:hypothetical protein SAMN05428989_3456 [Pseudoxanthomonas sp. GM95]|uniref:hypothetical protein n=1 Tax=Pseudoxanthomonas sp. GM95 TaxID=1881043 RepID=UPI0008C0B38C|nr:hypothetical protein [Pseudoxanthomonas sp. GM95]SEM23677.1 hypothetical protein SAMN05428989_3456 [Pseudoxanthomonas sp. GM95]
MSTTTFTALQPFVPGGADYAASRQLFAALDFVEEWEAGDVCGFRSGPVSFILQDFHDDHFAHNLMLRICVADLDAWWKDMKQRDLETRFPGFRLGEPTDFPWGREVHMIDLAGVCWHIASD